jgi:hypothetical protein
LSKIGRQKLRNLRNGSLFRARLFASLHKVHRIESLVPSEDFTVHLQPTLSNFLRL